MSKDIILFHWAPTERRKQINRYGLRPSMRPTLSGNAEGWKAPYICFADTPSWAWTLSGGMKYARNLTGKWDLWQVWKNSLTSPYSTPDKSRPSGLYEVRTRFRVYKRDIWYVGTRIKEE